MKRLAYHESLSASVRGIQKSAKNESGTIEIKQGRLEGKKRGAGTQAAKVRHFPQAY